MWSLRETPGPCSNTISKWPCKRVEARDGVVDEHQLGSKRISATLEDRVFWTEIAESRYNVVTSFR